MVIMELLLSVMISLGWSLVVESKQADVDILPNDDPVLLFQNSTIVMFCNLYPGDDNYTAVDLQFSLIVSRYGRPIDWENLTTRLNQRSDVHCELSRWNLSCRISQTSLIVINSTSVQLIYPNVELEFDRACVTCLIENTEIVHQRYIYVGNVPLVHSTTLLTAKNCKELVIGWHDDPCPLKINYTVDLQSVSSNTNGTVSQNQKCSVNDLGTKCSVRFIIKDFSSLFNVSQYLLFISIKAQNKFGASFYNTTVDFLSLIKPNRLEISGVKWSDAASESGLFSLSLYVKLQKHCNNNSRVYQIQTSCAVDNNTVQVWLLHGEIDNISAERRVVLEPITLPAFTNCSLNVQCRNLNSNGHQVGYWSQPKWINISTPQSVPMTAVRVCSCCFHVSWSDAHMTNVTVYFKHLTKAEARGVMEAYCVDIEPDRSTINVHPGLSHVSLNLTANQNYSITVKARTAAGIKRTVLPNVLFIPQWNTVSEVATNFTAVAVTDTFVQLAWKMPLSSDVVNYTVVWCRFESTQSRLCSSELEWSESEHIVGTEHLVHNVHVVKAAKNIYGVALKTKHGHCSGIQWASCLYNITQRSFPPLVAVKSRTENSVILEILKPQCRSGQGFAYAFSVHYAQSQLATDAGSLLVTRDYELLNNQLMISNLSAGTQYAFTVRSVSVAGLSVETVVSANTTAKSWWSFDVLIAVLICSPVLFILLLFGVYHFARWQYLKCKTWYTIPITTPHSKTTRENVTKHLNAKP